jgi:hypothetical protein
MRESMPALSLPPKEQPSRNRRDKAKALTPSKEYLAKKVLDEVDFSSLDETLEKMPKTATSEKVMDVQDDEILQEWGNELGKKIDTVEESSKARTSVPFSGLKTLTETGYRNAKAEKEGRMFNVPEAKKPEAPQEKVVIDQDRLATLRKHIEKPEDSVQVAKEKLQQRLQGLSAEEGNLIQKKNAILSDMGIWGRFRMSLSKLTNGVAVSQEARDLAKVEADLEKKDAERNKLQEELQFMSYGENKSGRPKPDATVEKWADEGKTLNVRRPDGSWAKGRVMDVATDGTVELSVEGTAKGSFQIMNVTAKEVVAWQNNGPLDKSFMKSERQVAKDIVRETAAAMIPGVRTTAERDQDELEAKQGIQLSPDQFTDPKEFDKELEKGVEEPLDTSFLKTKRQAAKDMLRDAAAIVPGIKTSLERDQEKSDAAFEAGLTNQKREMRKRAGEGMDINSAQEILGKKVAADLWEKANKNMIANPLAMGFIAMENGDKKVNAATLYVYEVAKALEAQRNKDLEMFETAAGHLFDWNEKLGLHDDYVDSLISTPLQDKKPAKRVGKK